MTPPGFKVFLALEPAGLRNGIERLSASARHRTTRNPCAATAVTPRREARRLRTAGGSASRPAVAATNTQARRSTAHARTVNHPSLPAPRANQTARLRVDPRQYLVPLATRARGRGDTNRCSVGAVDRVESPPADIENARQFQRSAPSVQAPVQRGEALHESTIFFASKDGTSTRRYRKRDGHLPCTSQVPR